MITKAKIVGCLIAVGMLISIIPCAIVAASETGTGNHIKTLDTEIRLEIAEATSTAHLKNNVLDLYFTEQNSNLWQYQWQPGQWGESCYHEHFGVYTGAAGRTLESEEFTIDQSFTDPGGVPGTVTAVLHYGDVQVKRKITLISGDIRFFEIEYTVKNTGSSTLNDVRFFQTIDFDIPWTSDCGDDHAWYDAEHDYVIVRDDDHDFENSFTGSIPSDRHGVDHWYTEIYDDWDDGNLNNANSYGPGDPAIGMQYNFGNLAAGSEEIVTITVWSGEPTEEMEPEFNSITFGDNKVEHHTEDYPSEYNNDHCNVLRRGQSFDLNADIENFNDEDHEIRFMIDKPKLICQMITAKKKGTLGTGWDCVYHRNGNNFNFEMHIPGDDQVGKYQLVGDIVKKDGTEIYDTYGDDEDTPEFYVLFNPWSSEDDDVKGLLEHEIPLYLGDNAWEYHKDYFRMWTLMPGKKEIFDTVMERVSGETSASKVTEEILDLSISNAGYNGRKQFNLKHPDEGYNLPSDYGDLEFIDSFDTSEILPGYWFNIGYMDDYEAVTLGNVPTIINDWKNGKKQYGQCNHFGAIGISLLRSSGIPSRMVTTIDGKMAQNPYAQWNFHVWAEIWDGHSFGEDNWKAIATTEQIGQSSRNAPVFKTMTESYVESGSDPLKLQDYVQMVFTEKVVRKWFWWIIEEDNIAELYTAYPTAESYINLNMLRMGVTNLDDQLEINVATDKSEYNLGEDVLINVYITNNNDVQIITNLTTIITGMSPGDMMDYRFSDTKEINILPHTTISEVYILRKEDYVTNRYYSILSHITKTSGHTTFKINSGLNLTTILPETVLISETFDVTLETKNTFGIPLTNIEIQADFPYYADVGGAPVNFIIPTLAPGETNTATWVVSIPFDGYQSMAFTAQSERGDYEQIFAGTEVMSNPFLRVDIEVPSSVQKDSTFAVTATIVNEGDLAAEGVQSELSLPPELTTSDDLIKYIGTIDPHDNTTIMWNIAADEAGTSAFTITTDSSTTSGEDVIFIPIFIYDHDLELSVEQSQIEADGELHNVEMTIHNLGTVEDSVFLQYLVTNPDISFSIYDGAERIISQSVLVPANGDKILNLKIIPEYEATGMITVHATSELDPTASGSINVEVISFIPQIDLDLYTGWNLISVPLNLNTWELGEESVVDDPLNVTPENSLAAIYRYDNPSESFEMSIHYADLGWYPATESFTELEPGRGYWLWAENDCTLTFTGTAPSDLDVSLDSGWNCVGWYSTSVAELGEESVVDDPLSVTPENSLAAIYRYDNPSKSFEMSIHYADLGWYPATESFTELEPGRGYWLWAENDCLWNHET